MSKSIKAQAEELGISAHKQGLGDASEQWVVTVRAAEPNENGRYDYHHSELGSSSNHMQEVQVLKQVIEEIKRSRGIL